MKKGLLLLLATVSFWAKAETLRLDENIKFLVIDGADAQAERWQRYESKDLDSGVHQIVIRYSGELKNGNRDTIFTSRPYIFSLDLDGRDAEISVPRMRSVSQADAFFRSPEWQIRFSDGTEQTLAAEQLQGTGLLAYDDLIALVAEYNGENAASALPAMTVVLAESEAKAQLGSVDTLEQLQHWYNQATDEEKVAFKVWLAQQ
uniref:YccT family protein n=1 Tax=Thaumasiovibrio occultus TaxID=1891184 RepID=UPI000B353279|nr:DUF2057 domain-containing protein [Thaumasiovibrio occultus]